MLKWSSRSLGARKKRVVFMAVISTCVTLTLLLYLHCPQGSVCLSPHMAYSDLQGSYTSAWNITTDLAHIFRAIHNVNSLHKSLKMLQNKSESFMQRSDLLFSLSQQAPASLKINLVSLKNKLDNLVLDLNLTAAHMDELSRLDSLAQIVSKQAQGGVIILVSTDMSYSSMALNLYLTSFKKLNISNYLFMGSDDQVCPFLQFHGAVCHTHFQGSSASEVSNWGTAEFRRKTHLKTKVVLDALLLGYTVLIVDVDIIFFKNPFPYLRCRTCDVQIQNDMVEGNSGFYLVRPTKASKHLHHTAWQLSQSPTNTLSNQKLLDRTMEKMAAAGEIKIQILPAELFPMGEEYFEQGHRMFAGDIPCKQCVLVHNNWIVSGAAKELRFKECGLWDVDLGGYYSDSSRRYLMYSNPDEYGAETDALKAALSIGYLLNRTVILPSFTCRGCTYKACDNSHNACSLHTHYRISTFDRYFGGKYREHVFLQHKLVPAAVKQSLSPLLYINTTSGPLYSSSHNVKNIMIYNPMNMTGGASVEEILSWFGGEMINFSILHFHSLYGAFAGFGHFGTNHEELQVNLSRAFSKTDYRNY